MLKKLFNRDTCLIYLYMAFAALLVCANAIAAKQVYIGKWFGVDVSITAGIICYPFTFLITDVIGELYGKKKATYAVIGGFIGQIVAIVLQVIANVIPGNSQSMTEAFNTVLGANWILVIGSLTACLVSQSWDVFIFHKIRDAYIRKHGSTKGGRWIWNNCSTMSSQLIDSIIFQIGLFIMLGVSQGFWMPAGVWFATLFAYWLIKVAIAAIDTPIFYLCTNNYKHKKEEHHCECHE